MAAEMNRKKHLSIVGATAVVAALGVPVAEFPADLLKGRDDLGNKKGRRSF